MTTESINKRLKIIDDLQKEVNKVKELLDESLENNADYQKAAEEVSQVAKEAKMKKDKVMSSTTVRALNEQLKDLRDQIKENKEILAQDFADYYKDSGSLEIVDPEGNTKRIIFSFKLVNQ